MCVRRCLGWKGKDEESHPSTVGSSKADTEMRAKAQLCEEGEESFCTKKKNFKKKLIVYF